VQLYFAPALVRVDLADGDTVGDRPVLFESLRTNAMWHGAITFGGAIYRPLGSRYDLLLGAEDFVLIWNTRAMMRRMQDTELGLAYVGFNGPPTPTRPHLPRVRIGLSRRIPG
jgi:hypothetical protein